MIDLTVDFPLWTVVSWVLIASLFVVAFRMRAAMRARLNSLERAVYGHARTEHPDWRYPSFHRAASEMMLDAIMYPQDRLRKIDEAEQYARRAIELAETEDQSNFTVKLLEAILRERASVQADNDTEG